MSWRRFNFHLGATRPGMRPLGGCSTRKPAPSAVVVIDEDDDGDEASDSEVFIIDGAAGRAAPAAPGRRTKKGNDSSGDVINLDDDEDDEKVEEEDTGRGDKAGPSTSRATGSPAATTPGRGSPRNRYGLDCTSDSSESDSSEGWDSDSDDGGTSDCEILDDTSGTARKMWETAASRKTMPHVVHGSKVGRATASTSSAGSETEPDENAEDLYGAEHDLAENIFRYFKDVWKEGTQNSTACAKDGPAECHLDENMRFNDAWKEGEQNRTGCAMDGIGPSSEPNAQECSNGNVSNGKEAKCMQNSTVGSRDGPDPSSVPNTNRCSNESVHNGKKSDCSGSSTHSDDGAVPDKTPEQSPCLDETFVYSFVSANRVFPASSSADRKGESPPMPVSTPEKIDEKMSEGACSQKDQSPSGAHNVFNKDICSARDDGSVSCQQAEVSPLTSRYDSLRQFGENCPQVQADSCARGAVSACVNVTSGSFSSQKDLADDAEELGQESSDFQNGLIGEREKHKESIEYKRAAEEEWASRQRQLQIQAEEAKEAKRLRKRKKAEALRLLDMEKRQKQRLQEVRETQRKNEEEIQLKEHYRSIVRKELEDTEWRYRDMASILRVLGIPVEGSEVKAAYKQALLKFHPDRVSRSDIYQQVKAEETFKFISRLKEKLPRFV